MRIAIGGILHETSTFSVEPTTLEQFKQREMCFGSEVIDTYTGTGTAFGGFIDAARDADFQVAPTFTAWAMPGGIVPAETANTLNDHLIQGIKQVLSEGPIDGVLLSLHGAMVSAGDPDAESTTVRRVRELVGADLPIIVELDLHGNITQELVHLATVCIAYDEYPHTDVYERGYEAGLLMARIVRSGIRPTPYAINVPLLAGMQRQYTHAEPMLSLKHLAHDLEHERGVLNVSTLCGFPFADIPHTSFTLIVTTDNTPDQARAGAEHLARYVWDHRQEFIVTPKPIDEAVEYAMAAPQAPIVLADIGDNSGAGTPSDGTALLESLLRLGAQRAVVVPINDPEVVQTAIQAGVGATISVKLGGKIDDFHGSPLPVTAQVIRLTEGEFVIKGPMLTGTTVKLGPTAVLEIPGERGGAVQVITTTYRTQPLCLEMLRSQGIEPMEQQIIVVKSSVHYRAAFTPIAAEIIEVDSPGLSSPNFSTFSFHQLKRPIFPLDPDMTWDPA